MGRFFMCGSFIFFIGWCWCCAEYPVCNRDDKPTAPVWKIQSSTHETRAVIEAPWTSGETTMVFKPNIGGFNRTRNRLLSCQLIKLGLLLNGFRFRVDEDQRNCTFRQLPLPWVIMEGQRPIRANSSF